MVSIKGLRDRCGVSQSRFSIITGIPKRTIENWESGRSSPPVYLLHFLEYWLLQRLCPC